MIDHRATSPNITRPPPLLPPSDPRHRPAVGPRGGAFFDERGTTASRGQSADRADPADRLQPAISCIPKRWSTQIFSLQIFKRNVTEFAPHPKVNCVRQLDIE